MADQPPSSGALQPPGVAVGGGSPTAPLEIGAETATLAAALNSFKAPGNVSLPLPLVHMSVARWFPAIMTERVLRPRHCSVFNEDLLYFFYGGAFYRKGLQPTRNATELPVAFVFHPSILSSVCRLFPFDTGALAMGHFGDWGTRFRGFRKQFELLMNGQLGPAKLLVQCLYGSNRSYLRGLPSAEIRNGPAPLPELYGFLSADLTANGIDSRQCAIECQCVGHIPLDRSLIWIACPESMTDLLAEYCKSTDHVPKYFLYPSHRIFRPVEIAAQIALRAQEDVIDLFVDPPKSSS
jgi:hypothetical protein